ncbi:MAG TPA: argininosuccinate lyase, partial [Terriglobales bacterium]|nr:argininosuccinate lyase [Terriglobales bacterium]
IAAEAGSASFLQDEEVEDVHHFVEKKLVELIGDAGYKLHAGRSRNEQIATDLRLYVRDQIDACQDLVLEWLQVLVHRAEEAGSAVMPAYTHLQPAAPVLVSHWLLAYTEMFFRDLERLGDCRARVNQCPLGSGAVAGATLPLDRHAMAADLGFDAPTANSIDATSGRDFAIEFVQALTLMAAHLSRWAEEMIIFSTQEFGFVVLPESHSTGSSALPQKKNPDALELIRAKAGRMLGLATALVACVKALPLAYNKDLQELQEPIFEAAQTAVDELKIATQFMRNVAFNFARMQQAAAGGFMAAMAAATYLVRRGVPFRLAHEYVGRAVQLCLEKGCELQGLSLEELRVLCPQFGEDIYSHLTLPAVLASHDVYGGTATAQVSEALKSARQRLDGKKKEVYAHA